MGRNSRLLYHKPDKNAIVTIAISNILRSQEISPLFHFTDGAPVEPCPAILESLERGNAPHFLSGNDRTTAGSANIGIRRYRKSRQEKNRQAAAHATACLFKKINYLAHLREREREAGGAACSFFPFPVTE